MRKRRLGKTDDQISEIGYGAMALSLRDRPSELEAAEVLTQIQAAGVNLFDTADTYCLGPDDLHHNERLLARVFKDSPGVVIATKGGTRRTAQGWQVDGSPDFLYRSICESFEALGGSAPIPIWQLHWPDPRFRVAEMLQPAVRAVAEGLVKFIGVCNFSRAQLEEACDAVPLVSVQNQFNLWHREAETDGVIEFCERHDLLFLPWRPLGGLGLSHRLAEIGQLSDVARNRGVTPQRLMIAWHLAKSRCIVPIPGSRQLGHFFDCLAALEISLDETEMRQLNSIGNRELPRRERPSSWEGMPPLS